VWVRAGWGLALSLLALGWIACGPSPERPPATSGRPPPARPLESAGSPTPLPTAADASRAQRFVDRDSAASWTFADASVRRDHGQRLAAKLAAQLDAEPLPPSSGTNAASGVGFAFALVLDGEPVLFKARGGADAESRRPATPDTIYRIASITKTFTATAIMILRDEGKLALADPLATHLTELDPPYPHQDAPPLRIEQILSHSAGLVRSGPYAELARPSTEADLVEAMRLPLANDPGLGHRYSNFGFGLLGLVVARRSGGGPYREFVQRRILDPLGMTSSGFDLAKLPPERLATGYRIEAGVLRPTPVTANGAGEGAGGLWASVRDMTAFLRLELGAWPPRDDPDDGPVRRATLREMHAARVPFALGTTTLGGVSRPWVRSVGLGFEITKGCYFERLVGHDGDLDGFHARMRFDPDRGIGMVLLGNSDTVDVAGIVERVIDTIATEDLLQPRQKQPAPALVERAADVVKRIGASWTAAEHAQVFAEIPGRTSQPEIAGLLTRLAKEVGGCSSAAPRVEGAVDALDVELVFRCARGIVRVQVRGAGAPLRLTSFRADPMTPAETEQLDLVAGLLPRMQKRDDASLAKVLSTNPKLVSAASKLLLKAGADAGTCRADGGDVSPWTHAASFRLSCTRGKAVLRLQTQKSGGVDLQGIDMPVKCLR
jgi:CubicO group peptidase (beta-lactamase class C family)